jgi:isochorismate synthase
LELSFTGMSNFEKKYMELDESSGWVFYRSPGTNPIVYLGGKCQTMSCDSGEWLKQDGFVLAPFDANQDPFVFVQQDFKQIGLSEQELNAMFDKGIAAIDEARDLPPGAETQRSDYEYQFDLFKDKLDAADLEKVILSRVMIKKGMKPGAAFDLFLAIAKKYPRAFVHLSYSPFTGLWLGASPEVLLKKKGPLFETISLAGTANWKEVSFNQLWKNKERHEQALVSRFVEDQLKECHVLQFQKEGPETVRSGTMAHISTRYRFQLDSNAEAINVLEKLHPTPAVCGLPKSLALNLIHSTESHKRKYYSGYIGPVTANQGFELYVNIRCLQFVENGVQLFVGGGLTVDSELQSEWCETELKAQTLLSAISEL